MTHSLHRSALSRPLDDDFVVFALAAQGVNSKDAASKLRTIYKILRKHRPVNLADGFNSIYTGKSADEIEASIGDSAYPAAVYTSLDTVIKVLKELTGADQGMSVVVSGDYRKLIKAVKEAGLTPHTINLSLGVFGDYEGRTDPAVADIASMCGHGLVCQRRIKKAINEVKKGKQDAVSLARELASACTCGVFNPERAVRIMLSAAGKGDACQ